MKYIFYVILVSLLVGCSQTDQSKENEENAIEQSEGLEGIPTELIEENMIPIEQQVLDRLNSFLLLSYVGDVKPNLTVDGDYLVLLNIVRSFPEEVPVLSTDDSYHGKYDLYEIADVQQALLKYHGFTIDFKKFTKAQFSDEEKIIVQGDNVLLLSSEEPTQIGNNAPVIKSFEQMEEGVYSVHFQYNSFLMDEYEEVTGKEWDPAYSQFPIEKWPEEFKPYVKENPTNYFAIFIENKYGLALTYLSQKVVEEETENEDTEGNVFDGIIEMDELK